MENDKIMEKLKVIYTAIYPYNKFIGKNLPEILEEFTKNNNEDNITKIYKTLMDLQSTYPDFYKWYNKKVISDLKLKRNNRNIFFAVSLILEKEKIERRLTGLAITKRNLEESKICTFRVFPEYRKQGVGTALLKVCFSYLKTQKPLISISKENVIAFQGIINKYGWEKTQILPNYYKEGSIEYVYNGKLKKGGTYANKNGKNYHSHIQCW